MGLRHEKCLFATDVTATGLKCKKNIDVKHFLLGGLKPLKIAVKIGCSHFWVYAIFFIIINKNEVLPGVQSMIYTAKKCTTCFNVDKNVIEKCLLLTLFTVVNNIFHYCRTRFKINCVVEYF